MTKTDSHFWLEEIENPRCLDWVKQENNLTEQQLTPHPDFQTTRDFARKVLTDPHKIPYGWFKGDWYYNIWSDEKNPLGVIRRTLAAPLPQVNWQTIFDVDTYSTSKGQNWTIKSFDINPYDPSVALLSLSPGGKDECEIYEFDLKLLRLNTSGFYSSLAKQWASWKSAHEILISKGLTNASGYPRNLHSVSKTSKEPWSPPVYVTEDKAVMSYTWAEEIQKDTFRNILCVAQDFFTNEYFEVTDQNNVVPVPSPRRSYFAGFWKEGLLFFLTEDWLSFKSGDLLWREETSTQYRRIFGHENARFLHHARVENQRLFVECLENTISSVYEISDLAGVKPLSFLTGPKDQIIDLHLSSFDGDRNRMSVVCSHFFEPETVWIQNTSGQWDTLFQGVAYFDSSKFKAELFWAMSEDGTKVPYKVLSRKDFSEPAPCWVHGYGGFQISLSINYQPLIVENWIKGGGIYIQAHIRGGNEFGPDWHQQSLKMNRQRCYQDFAAVIADAQKRGLTTPAQTVLAGRSNGGLLVGATACLYPHLMKAVICGVPLLDMERYHHLLAGASWAAEYGTVDDSPQMREYLLSYSPYHQLDTAGSLPDFYIYTSTYDDRVHPGHGRKMTAKLKEKKHSVLFYEVFEGGHKGHLDPQAGAHGFALRVSFAKEKTNYVSR
ncbi:MAG: prolyl oligopeptidase family serine peptidase [Pseudobdellovibrionaceae bacterium]